MSLSRYTVTPESNALDMGDGVPSPVVEEQEVPTKQFPTLSALSTKWLGLVSALWVQAISGNNYTFANYSVELKAILGINQVSLNGLSTAKDVGKAFGVIAGFLNDYIPPWAILLIGSLDGLLGYGVQWLVISRKIRPLPFWMMCTVLCMGGNSTTWMNTAVLVTCVRNFQRNRGPVSGILKAYVGLSTAIFTDLCMAIFAGNTSAFVLMLALIPLGVCVVAMFLLKPVECDSELNADRESEELRCFFVLNLLAIVLAFYLLASSLSGMKKGLVSKVIVGGLCLILVAPVVLPIYLHVRVARRKRQMMSAEKLSKQKRNDMAAMIAIAHRDGRSMPAPALGALVHRDVEAYETHGEVMGPKGGEVSRVDGEATRQYGDDKVCLADSERRQYMDAKEASSTEREAEVHAIAVDVSKKPEANHGKDNVHSGKRELGEEFTALQAMKTVDFWLLFFCFLCGVGTGMAVINNLGQIGESLGYSSVSIFLSLISICGFFGRLGSGELSEYLIRLKAVPRPVLLAVSQLVMVLGYLSLATGASWSLYVGSIVVGVCYGVRLSVSVPVTSEMFGLKALGLMYNMLILNLPLGSLLFSSLLAGFLYDHEAAKDGLSTTCMGAHCYRLVFLLMAAVSGIGFMMDSILALRTRPLYLQIYHSKHCKS